MKNQIKSISRFGGFDAQLKDGKYLGSWGGYEIDLKYKGDTYTLKTLKGVNGIGIKVLVIIENGVATFELFNN